MSSVDENCNFRNLYLDMANPSDHVNVDRIEIDGVEYQMVAEKPKATNIICDRFYYYGEEIIK